MKKFWLILALGYIIAIPCHVVGEESPPVKNPINDPARTIHHRVAKIAATGKVAEITDTTIRIERTVKGNMEVMDFDLEKPAQGIKSGDKIRIHYIEKDGKRVVTKVTKIDKKLEAPSVRKEGNVAGEQDTSVSKRK
jgi:hypothetical protein